MREICDKQDITWRSFVDLGNAGTGAIARQWNHSATPTMYVLDHKGVIQHKWVGAPGEKLLDAAIEGLIQSVKP